MFEFHQILKHIQHIYGFQDVLQYIVLALYFLLVFYLGTLPYTLAVKIIQ